MHYGARFYNPRLGRFVSADSIVPQPGEPQALNRYAYAANNPVIYRDPSGHYITLYGNPGVRYAGPWNQGQRELAVRMDEGQVFVLRGGTEFANVAEQDLANYYATGNEAYMPAAGGALEGAMGYAINDAAVASGYAARYTSLLGKLAGGYVGASFVLGAGYVPKAGSEECAGQGPPRGERLGYTETPRDAAARANAAANKFPPIKPGSAGGPTAGKRFPQDVKDQAYKENPTRTCVYCRRPGMATQVDHAIPKSRDGNATIDNAQLTCPHCNPSKGAGDFPVNPPPRYTGPWPPPWW
jgi:hypothetical protein